MLCVHVPHGLNETLKRVPVGAFGFQRACPASGLEVQMQLRVRKQPAVVQSSTSRGPDKGTAVELSTKRSK